LQLLTADCGPQRNCLRRLTISAYWGTPDAICSLRGFPSLTQSGPHIGMHLNDIDREMTNLCRYARSVPICIEMDADLPSLDQLRNNAAECIRLAEAARTSEHKSFFIEMAERWLTLAEHAEKTQAR
jgi:hypothetical protein